MKAKARAASDDPLFALLDELLALDPSPRAGGAASLRARLVSRLYFAGFQVVEEIGSVGERTVPFVLGVKGRPRNSERAVLVAATLRPSRVLPTPRAVEPADSLIVSPRLPTGVASVACALEAMARLREAELNRPLVVLVAFDEAERGSALQAVRGRYGLDVGSALLLHPTGGGVAVASPGVVVLDVALRRREPEWSVTSLAHTTRVTTTGQLAVHDLLAAMARATQEGARLFEPAGRADGAAGAAGGVLASASEPTPARGLSYATARPERLGYPFGVEVRAAHDVFCSLRAALPSLAATGLQADGDTLRLSLRLPLEPDADLDALDRQLEVAAGALRVEAGVELEVIPRLHRPPFTAGAKVRELLAQKAPDRVPSSSPLASEAGFAGTSDVALLGPEEPLQGATMPRARVAEITALLNRLLTRLTS